MRNILLSVFAILAINANAQSTIPNGSFEQWTTISYNNLDNYVTESGRAQFLLGSTTTIKSSDAQNGNSSVKLETKTTGQDTLFGFFTSGDFDRSNGFPYSQKPDSLVGYYKSNVLAGDTALIIVRFSKLGNIFSFNLKTFVGVQNAWTRFAFPLNLAITPDSMFIAAASSNAINEVGVQPGSWIMFDNFSFVGTGITQPILNGDFENWTIHTYENPTNWSSTNIRGSQLGQFSSTKTTDKTHGNFALRLETVKIFDDTMGYITNGVFGRDSVMGGQPFNIVFDTLVGQYKYSPVGLDSAAMVLTFSKNRNVVGGRYYFFSPSSTYQQFQIPFVLPQIPDTLRIDITSSINDGFIGSTLFIDHLVLKSILTNIDKESNLFQEISLYPNPSNEYIKLEFVNHSQVATVQIIDQIGRTYYNYDIYKGDQKINIDLQSLPSGTYYVRISNNDEVVYKQITKL